MVRDFLRMVSRNPKIVDGEFPKSEPFNRKFRNGTVISDKKYLEIWLFLGSYLIENLVNSGKWGHVQLTAPGISTHPAPSYHPGRFPIYQRGQMVTDFLRMVSRNPKIVDQELPKSEPFNRKWNSEWNGNFRQKISRNLAFP